MGTVLVSMNCRISSATVCITPTMKSPLEQARSRKLGGAALVGLVGAGLKLWLLQAQGEPGRVDLRVDRVERVDQICRAARPGLQGWRCRCGLRAAHSIVL